MRKISIALISTTLLFSCKQENTIPKITENKKQLYAKAGWLIGSWKNTQGKENMTETWIHDNDSVYTGALDVVQGNDTVFRERIRLVERADKIYYIVSVPGKNNEKPVSFELTSATATELVFENPKHDFPSRISYLNFGSDSLVAQISGIQKGVLKTEKFPMKKVK